MSSIEFGIIFNPTNVLMKHEVWIKGEAVSNDTLGQPVERQQFCQKGRSFFTRKAAEGFVQYQQEMRQFRGVV
jgi:hypothetical protein